MKKAYLVLRDGHIFEGASAGAVKNTVGELVFTTGMNGYLETLTDPSYYGQIVLQTFPMIGNYGLISPDFEGAPALFGYVARELTSRPSNFRSEGGLDSFLGGAGIPAVTGIDTREITRIIRENGVMNAGIFGELPDSAECNRLLDGYAVKNAVSSVSVCRREVFAPSGALRYRIALLDFGAKKNIIRSLVRRGCEVTLLPYDTAAGEILFGGYDGLMLSNGPGDPAENTGVIRELSALLGKIPMFGICLGHQLLALAAGGKTAKLVYGHRGTNQPVRDLAGCRTYMTSQNHGYAVTGDVPGGVLRYRNANDGTCEGIDYPGLRAFTVQFHPEACSGPRDTDFLFDRFLSMIEKGGEC